MLPDVLEAVSLLWIVLPTVQVFVHCLIIM
jgi:hypothetical protein